ncbi:MAG: hypothetical protein AAGG75_17985 [Bacteroidota bacterium]
MAKKRFDISSTLNKNKEAQLAKKIPLKKTTKDPDQIKERVEEIHADEQPKAVAAPKPPPPPPPPEKVKLVRMTIDTPEEMHKKLKIKTIERGLSIRDYVLKLIEADLKKSK